MSMSFPLGQDEANRTGAKPSIPLQCIITPQQLSGPVETAEALEERPTQGDCLAPIGSSTL